MNAALRTSAAHVFVEDLGHPELGRDDAHHLLKVLRIRESDVISVSDGRGSWGTATVSREGAVTMLEGPHFVPASANRLGVAFVPVKGERPELVVQKLTEIGIDDIYPLAPTTRSVVKWDGEKADKNHARLAKVSREASMQSRRVWLPIVHEIRTLESVVALEGCVVADPDGRSLSGADRLIVVGPEGGFSTDELASATTVSLGESILRAETAAIVAGALMVNMARG